MSLGVIQTRSGRMVNVLNFKPEDVDLDDIACSLSRQARFNGHTTEFYSVAQHCVHASKVAEQLGYIKPVQQWALLHDAAEAYIGDITSPIKALFPGLEAVENRILYWVCVRVGLLPPHRNPHGFLIKMIDEELLAIEAARFMTPDAWPNPPASRLHSGFTIESGWEPERARLQFAHRAVELGLTPGAKLGGVL